MQTLQDFALACAPLSSDDIYELFEEASDAMRDTIYAILGSAEDSEPARAALNKLGYMYGVASLINY